VQGGAFVSPGIGGVQGGAFVSPAKAVIPRRNVKAMAVPSLFRFFMVFSLTWVVELRLRFYLETNKEKQVLETARAFQWKRAIPACTA